MKEKIILAPGANATELMRTLARHGRNTFGVRIMNSLQLAEHLMMKNGITAEGAFISSSGKPAVYADFLRKKVCGYFKTVSYSDAVNLSQAVDSARNLICDDEKSEMHGRLSSGEFPEKNSALLAAYDFYTDFLEKNGKYDNITEIRKVISSGCRADAEYCILKEFPVTPLERKLIETASAGNYEELSLSELAGKEAAPLHIEKYISSYGASNEAEWIIGEILEKNIPVDSCTVAAADIPQYSQVFFDLCSLYDIPVTFGCGIPVSNSNPAALLSLLDSLSGKGFFGVDAYKALFASYAFDRNKFREKLTGEYRPDKISEAAGNLRISFSAAENAEKISAYEKSSLLTDKDKEILGNVRILAEEFGKGPSYIISEYSAIRKGPCAKYDNSALKVITESLDIYMPYSDDGSFSEIVPQILSKQICLENSKEGCLHVTGITSAINTIRENLFVCGMSAAVFPGSPEENYLLLDSDYLKFGEKDSVPGSEKTVKDKLRLASDLVSFASACGSRIFMSHSDFNLADIKETNPSSVLFDFFAKEKGGSATVDDFNASSVKTGFFEKNFSVDRRVGEEYKSGHIAVPDEKSEEDEDETVGALKRTFSPSDIETFLSCPRRFYLTSVLGIPDEGKNDPFEVIPANDFGTLVHKMMEKLSEEKMPEDEFVAAGRKAFRDYLLSRPPFSNENSEAEEEDFIDCLRNGYGMHKGDTVAAEEKLTVLHPCGITVRGIPDRIEKYDGTYTVVDYKTKRKIGHNPDDPESFIQTLLYAYMVKEAMGIDVSECEYRYLRLGRTVGRSYDQEMRTEVDSCLITLADALDRMKFETTADTDNCKYCNLKGICGRNEEAAE